MTLLVYQGWPRQRSLSIVWLLLDRTVDPTVAPVTPLKRLKLHTDRYVGLLEDMNVVRVVDVANTGNDVAVLLVNLEHLARGLLGDVAEERHLEGDLVCIL